MEHLLQAGAFDPHEYPVDLDKITGIELAFKVKIQAKGKLSSVLTLKDDPEIIQYLKDQLILTEVYFNSVFHLFLSHNSLIH
jgi:hypothetical protein